MEHVYIRGRGITCSLGSDVEDIIARVKNKECKTVDLPIRIASLSYTRPYYQIPGSDRESLSDLEKYFYQVLFDTVYRAIEDSGLTGKEIENCALFFGSTSIDMPMFEKTYKNLEKNSAKILSYESPGYGKIASIVAERFNVNGPCYTFTTACTSSANCLLYASSMIKTAKISVNIFN